LLAHPAEAVQPGVRSPGSRAGGRAG
jgi:hypothetical protein